MDVLWKNEEPRQIDCKNKNEWMNVHLGCEHAQSEFHIIHTWKRSWRNWNLAQAN
jgi:hypothetical protein